MGTPLTVVGGWLNLPSLAGALGTVGALDRWLDATLAREALRLAGHKLPVKTKFVQRADT